jgi:predicted AAA+ superfamily ATPase
MIHRTISQYLTYVASKFPVVVLTGPRQSGKTTLVEKLFSYKAYVSLEDPDVRDFALTDPRGFLNQYKEGAIIDEAQNVPSLFSYIQTRVDQSKKDGEFVLTGSQNFSLVEGISQSLAGRAAVAHLLPLSIEELISDNETVENPFTFIQKGFYPRVYDKNIPATDWFKSYINTYLERDVRKITNIYDLSKFQLFLKLCAGRIGQLLNMSSLASDCGVTHSTINSWISILEASFVVFLLRPHHKNFNKRLVKQPKLYFYDTGLASHLLGLHKSEDLVSHYMRGALFENFVVADLIKQRYNQGRESNLNFWRDNHGHEVDVVISAGENLIPLEIKSSQTISSEQFKSLSYWYELTGKKNDGYLVYAGSASQERTVGSVMSWKDLYKINNSS